MTLTQHVTEILERAGKTFVEALLATQVLTPISTGKTVAVGGLGALISAVWTTAVKLEGSKVTELEDDAEHLFLDDDDDDDDDEEDEEDQPATPATPAPGSTVAPTPPTGQLAPVMNPGPVAPPQVDTANTPIGSQAQ